MVFEVDKIHLLSYSKVFKRLDTLVIVLGQNLIEVVGSL